MPDPLTESSAPQIAEHPECAKDRLAPPNRPRPETEARRDA